MPWSINPQFHTLYQQRFDEGLYALLLIFRCMTNKYVAHEFLRSRSQDIKGLHTNGPTGNSLRGHAIQAVEMNKISPTYKQKPGTIRD
jgi:hypothetical protein